MTGGKLATGIMLIISKVLRGGKLYPSINAKIAKLFYIMALIARVY